jgi:hypothetical protein
MLFKNTLQAEFNERVIQKFTRLEPANIGIRNINGARCALGINQDTAMGQ